MMATGRPSSGMTGRPDMAARPGTASRLAAQAGSARSISPAANERPMTGRENVAEIPERLPSGRLVTGRSKGKRTIKDQAYFLGTIRSKVADTTAETNKIISKSNDLSAQMNFLTTYRAEHEQLSKNVADIRKKQYDYETMLDALAHGITDEELKAEIVEDRAESQKLLAEVQNLLNDRQRREVELKKLQEKASKYEKAGESLLKEMSSEDQRRYHEMQKELLAESEKEDRLVQQYEETKNVERVKLEEELIFSPLKKEACQVLGRIRELESTLDDVNTQINKNPEDEKKRLEEKITKDNAAISALERQSHTLETSHETLRQHFGEGNVSLEKSTEKNAEIQEFLATFSDRKRAAEESLNASEEHAMNILAQHSRNLAAINDLPISTEADILASEERLRSTVGHVQQERRLRHDLLQMNFVDNSRELKKLETLADILTKEKVQRVAELKHWEDEASKQTTRASTEEMVTKRKAELAKEFTLLDEQKRKLSGSVSVLTGNKTEKEAKLQSDAHHQKIHRLESQLQTLKSQTSDLEKILTDNLTATSHAEAKERVLQKVKETNDILLRIAAAEAHSPNLE